VRKFYAENDVLVAEKAARKAADSTEGAWAAHSANLNAVIERVEAERKANARLAVGDHAATIAAQRGEQAALRAKEKADRFGAVGAGFFDGFGTSVR